MQEPTQLKSRAEARNFWDEKYREGEYSSVNALPGLLRADDLKGKDVLELGCGTLEESYPLADRAGRYWGVDVSMEALRLARRVIAVPENALLICADGTRQLPFRDSSMDICLSSNTLTLLGSNCEGAIKELTRISKGPIALVLTHLDTIKSKLESLPSEKLKHGTLVVFKGIGFIYFTEEEATAMLDSLGLRVTEVRTLTEFELANMNSSICEGPVYAENPDGRYSIFLRAEKKDPPPAMPSL